MNQGIYYDILSELTGTDIRNEYELVSTIKRTFSKEERV